MGRSSDSRTPELCERWLCETMETSTSGSEGGPLVPAASTVKSAVAGGALRE